MVGEEDATWRRERGGEDTTMEARGDAAWEESLPMERKRERKTEGRREEDCGGGNRRNEEAVARHAGLFRRGRTYVRIIPVIHVIRIIPVIPV
jgi:hypothetical protein